MPEKNGLLLIDYGTLQKPCMAELFRDLDNFPLDFAAITVVVLIEPSANHNYFIKQYIEGIFFRLPFSVQCVEFPGDSLQGLHIPNLTANSSVIFISQQINLIQEAEALRWETIKVPKACGELSRAHEKQFRKSVEEYIAKLESSENERLTIAVVLDIDDTLLFLAKSNSKTIFLNPHVYDFLVSLFKEYGSNNRIRIEMAVITSRDQVSERALERSTDHRSVRKVLEKLQVAVKDHAFAIEFSLEKIPVYFTQKKYGKMCDLYGNKTQTIAMLLDDNAEWTDEFDRDTNRPSHISYARVWARPPKSFFSFDNALFKRWSDQFVVKNTMFSSSHLFGSANPYRRVLLNQAEKEKTVSSKCCAIS